MEKGSDLARQAREIAEANPYVESPRPEIPELTGNTVTDAMNQFELSEARLGRLAAAFGVTIEEFPSILVELAVAMGGGLWPGEKRDRLYTCLGEGLTLDEMLVEAKKSQDSPAT